MSIPFPKPDTAHVYLLRCDPNGSKSAHMLVLIDLLDKSNDVHVSGLIVHATIDTEDRSYPNRTEVSLEPWSFSRTQVQVIYIGHLNNCKYLTDPALIPSYVIKYSSAAIFGQIVNPCVPIGMRQTFISALASNVFDYLVKKNNNQKDWNSILNCQQFARRFIIDGLGLNWPDSETLLAGDQVPLIIDFATMFLSTKRNLKSKFQRGK